MALYKSSFSNNDETLSLTSTAVGEVGSYNTPPLTIGPSTGVHLEASSNRLLAKSNASTGNTLYLNYGSGKDVYCTDMWLCKEINILKAMYNKLQPLVEATQKTDFSNFHVIYKQSTSYGNVTIAKNSVKVVVNSSQFRCFIGNVTNSYKVTKGYITFNFNSVNYVSTDSYFRLGLYSSVSSLSSESSYYPQNANNVVKFNNYVSGGGKYQIPVPNGTWFIAISSRYTNYVLTDITV